MKHFAFRLFTCVPSGARLSLDLDRSHPAVTTLYRDTARTGCATSATAYLRLPLARAPRTTARSSGRANPGGLAGYAEAGVVGLVQGVSELFPISSLGHSVLIPALGGGRWAQNLNVATSESPYLTFIVRLKLMVCQPAGVGGLGECLLGGVPVTEHQQGLGQVADRSRSALVIPASGISDPISLLQFPVLGTGWSVPGHRTRSGLRAGKTRTAARSSKDLNGAPPWES